MRRARVALEVDDPELVQQPPQRASHSRERGSAEVRSSRDEAHGTGPAPRLEYCAQGPAPEVDVVVVQALQVHAECVLGKAIYQLGTPFAAAVRRVADADDDRRIEPRRLGQDVELVN